MGLPNSSYADCDGPFAFPFVPLPLPFPGIGLAGTDGLAAVGAKPSLLPEPTFPLEPPTCRAGGLMDLTGGGGAGAFAFAFSHAGGGNTGTGGSLRGASSRAALLDELEATFSRGYGQGEGGRAGADATAAYLAGGTAGGLARPEPERALEWADPDGGRAMSSGSSRMNTCRWLGGQTLWADRRLRQK